MIHCNLFSISFIAIGILHVSAFTSIRPSFNRNDVLGKSSLKMGIDVSGLNFAPMPEELLNAAVTTTGTWTDLSNALIITGGLAFFAYEKRPRGSARDDLVEMRDSTVKSANLGAFSKKFIPKGTVVGRYPGFLLTMSDALDSKESDAARLCAQSYFFAVDDDKVLDPTNKAGVLENNMSFLGFLKTDTLIARINEPPMGGDVNLCTEIVNNGVTVIAERDIFANEELFMDYGRDYDRSSYATLPEEEVEEIVTPVERVKIAPIVEKLKMPASAISTETPSSTTSSSIFDSLIGNAKQNRDVVPSQDSRSQGILGAGYEINDKKGQISDGPLYRPALSMKESEELLKSLDEMSDEEVAAVLSKLKAAVNDRLQGDVADALLSKDGINETIGKDLRKEMGEMKKMPRAQPVDPAMRAKYNKELDAIENELEKIYSDPLGVWTEFMKNPERFLNEGEIGDLAEDENFQ